jgi:cytochrome c-type biogenesis protein
VALGAGLLAALNPCGFAMLPAYLGLLVAGPERDRHRSLLRAVQVTVAMTAGFVVVFGVFGLVVLPVSSAVEGYLPWASVLLGGFLVLASGWLLAGHPMPTVRLPVVSWALRPSWRSMLLFGVAYALASLSCTIAPFLAVVVLAFRRGSVVTGLALFLLYAAGMALVVGTVAVAVALARVTVTAGLHKAGRYVAKLAAGLLLLVGLYTLYYGVWELRVLAGAPAVDPVVAAAEQVRGALATWVRMLGSLGVAAVLAGLGLLALISSRRRTRAPSRRATTRQ